MSDAQKFQPRIAWLGLALVAATIVVQLPLVNRMVIPMDEGHLVSFASWMAQGKQLYLDMHTGIFPGIYLVTYGLFALFGEGLLVTRWAAVAVNVVTALCLWRIAARATDENWAWVAPLTYVALLPVAFPVLSMFNYSTLAVASGLCALWSLLRLFERGDTVSAISLGVFIACTVLTKQNFGFLVFVACAVALLLGRGTSPHLSGRWTTALLTIAVSGLVPTLLVVTGFIAAGTFGDLVESTIVALGGSQVEDFNNPIPPIFGAHPVDDARFTFLYTPPPIFNDLLEGGSTLGIRPSPLARSLAIRASYGLPLAALLLSAGLLVRDSNAGKGARRRDSRTVIVYAILFFPGIFPSAIWSHLAFVLIPILPVFAILLHRANALVATDANAATGPRMRRWFIPAAVSLVGLLGFAASAQTAMKTISRNAVPLELERANMFVSARMAGLLGGATRYLDACARPHEPIFAAPDIPIMYFLADRPTAQPYDLMIPGQVDGLLIARKLEEAGVRCAVFNPRMYPEFPPFAELFPQLATYLNNHFERVETIHGGNSEWVGLRRRRSGPMR